MLLEHGQGLLGGRPRGHSTEGDHGLVEQGLHEVAGTQPTSFQFVGLVAAATDEQNDGRQGNDGRENQANLHGVSLRGLADDWFPTLQ